MALHLRKSSAEAVPIDIAPLIDVVFQLLLFFMLTSSFVLHPGIRVALPKATTGRSVTSSTVILTLTKDHLIYWNDELVTLQELRRNLKETNGQQSILIRCDRHAYVDKLIALWDLCREVGATEVHIATLSE